MENDKALLEELLSKAEKAAEPGSLSKNKQVETKDLAAAVSSIESAGYSFIYDTQTGERSLTNNNMLRTQLGKKRPDGAAFFTTIDPQIPLKRGVFKCLLHPENPNREHYDEMGLATCKKSNLNSVYQVKRHMQKRHKDEWAVMEDERLTTEKDKDRKLQESVLKAMRPDKRKK